MTSSRSVLVSKVGNLLADHRLATKRCEDESKGVKSLKDRLEDLQTARAVLQAAATEVQEHSHKALASLVTRCLKAVFDDPYEFKIHFERRRGKTEADMVLLRDGKEFSPTDGVGGGVADVVSFALRLACLLLSRPPLRKLLVLDEPARHLSRDRQGAVRDLFLALAKECGVQILFVTHSQEMACGKVVEL